MKKLSHNEINKKKWDEAILSYQVSFPYALSWFLDLVSPGWEALVWGDYEAVMPLPVKRKWGIPYLVQPPGCQQLGIFCNVDPTQFLSQAINFINKHYPYVHIYFNYTNYHPSFKQRTNLILPIHKTYEEIRQSYHTNLKRNLKKAQSHQLIIYEESDWKKLFTAFKNGPYGKKVSHLWFQKIELIGNEAIKRNCAKIFSAYSKDKEYLAGMMCLLHQSRVIFWISTNTTQGRKLSAMHMLLDHAIRIFSKSYNILDFEGSENRNLAHFYRQFGSIHQDYFVYKKFLFF
ncbi:MAG: hypothetical protein N2Z72_01255 [Bacteroidales bacterium]|nr:hypothetical protein [Bacteroidales bacterium]